MMKIVIRVNDLTPLPVKHLDYSRISVFAKAAYEKTIASLLRKELSAESQAHLCCRFCDALKG
jgi:hypothetical protein